MFSTEEKEWVRKVAESSGAKIDNSAVFLSLFTEGYKKDPVAALQFGIAILLDKPMFFVVEEGTLLNSNVRALAKGIEYYDRDRPESLQKATEKLMKKAEKMGFIR